MTGVVVGVIGKIRSGKSSLSRGLAESLNWPYVSFGDEVRRIARQRGLEPSRENLQQIGEDLVDNRAQEFCDAVLAQAQWRPGESLIVDGIRHLKVVEILRELVRPSMLRLVYVKTADDIRVDRFVNDMHDEQDLERLDHHSTEAQVGTVLPQVADLTVNGDHSLEQLVAEVGIWLDALDTEIT